MRQLTMFALCVALAGCAMYSRIETGQPAAEVRAGHGAPTRIIAQADGGALWQYATQPFGTTFIQVRFDAAGQVVETWDGFAPEYLAKIKPGMGEQEVIDRLGPYRRIEYFALSREHVWDWNISNSGGPGIATRFNVHFRDGRVVRTSTSYEYGRDGRFFGGFGIGSGGSGVGFGMSF